MAGAPTINRYALPSFVALPSLAGLTMGDRAPIIGARQRQSKSANSPIAAGADGSTVLVFQLKDPALASDAVWIESLSIQLFEPDASKAISVIGVESDVGIGQAGAPGPTNGLMLNVIPPPVVPLPVFASGGVVGCFVEPPPLLRVNDLPKIAAGGFTSGILLEVVAAGRNGGAGASSLTVLGTILYRILSDVSP